MDEPLRGVVMNERRLEGCADLHIALDRHLVLRAKRVDVAERVLDHPPRMLGQCPGAVPRTEDEDLPLEELATADVIRCVRVDVGGVHWSSPELVST
jgi:hypothetical protein